MDHKIYLQKEKIPTFIFETQVMASQYVAQEIKKLILTKQKQKKNIILGLATGNFIILGSTPVRLYQELIKMHKQEKLSFKNVITFNLDEYYPMNKDQIQSYHRFMHENLFDEIDIPKENINIPNGQIDQKDIEQFCFEYERKIEELGGIDIQILGIGKSGHIGFNEPGSTLESTTRLIHLDPVTKLDAASDFYGIENVPQAAITMGVKTILSAKKIFIMAFTEGKAQIVHRSIEGTMTSDIPTTFLQDHKDCSFVIDCSASEDLTRVKSPWTLKSQTNQHQFQFDEFQTVRAVIWLSEKLNKAISLLTEQDYLNNDLQTLIKEISSEQLNEKILQILRTKINNFPIGKKKSKVLIFSPHPDDDVICMGGTMKKLIEQEHEVHVAYQTSGNIGVFNQDAQRYCYFLQEIAQKFNFKEKQQIQELVQRVNNNIETTSQGNCLSREILDIKAQIRNSEAYFASKECGLVHENIHFLNLPFYESGKIKKKPISDIDVKIVQDLINKIKPDFIFAAGDLTDPHGTHRVCLEIILESIKLVKEKLKFEVYLYRGAWQEWNIEMVDIAVPLSPGQLFQKRQAIFKHQSQKDRPLFPGNDPREFWQRSEARNRETARKFSNLGLEKHEAMEVYVNYKKIKYY